MRKRLATTISVIIVGLLVMGLNAMAETKGAVMIISYDGGARTVSAPDTARMTVPEDAYTLITLTGKADDSLGTLDVYLKDSGGEGWSRVITTPARYGQKGLYKEAEGDLKTPVGVFRVNTPFGIGEALSGFPGEYIRVDDTLYWDGDSSSALYNRLVSTDDYTDFDRSLSEHLIDYSGYYDYCLDIGYNAEGAPGKGSAIFLHCLKEDASTHGCVAVPEGVMIEILRLYAGGPMYMAIYEEGIPRG